MQLPSGSPVSSGHPTNPWAAADPGWSLSPSPPHLGTRDSARRRPRTHRSDGGWDWGGEGELCFEGTAATDTAQEADPSAAGEAGREGKWKLGKGAREGNAQALRTAPYLQGRREMESRQQRETDSVRGRRTTNPRSTRARLWSREALEEVARGRGELGSHRKRKPYSVFQTRKPGKYSLLLSRLGRLAGRAPAVVSVPAALSPRPARVFPAAPGTDPVPGQPTGTLLLPPGPQQSSLRLGRASRCGSVVRD